MTRLTLALLALLVALPLTSALAQTPTPQAPQAGDVRTDAKGIEQVWVPAGCFLMGTTDADYERIRAERPPFWVQTNLRAERPQHEVCLTEGYWIDRTEITNASWAAFVEDGGYTTEAYWSADGWAWLQDQAPDSLPRECHTHPEPDYPRACITWYEAEAYAAWRGGSLPTEAQWEYAARGPEALIYPWGNDWDPALANVLDSDDTTEVGSYPDGASWVGALDMAGNLMEWTQDWYDAQYYADSVRDDPAGPDTGTIKTERGGWWGSNAYVARTAYRHDEDPPTYQDHHIGARIVSPGEAAMTE